MNIEERINWLKSKRNLSVQTLIYRLKNITMDSDLMTLTLDINKINSEIQMLYESLKDDE